MGHHRHRTGAQRVPRLSPGPGNRAAVAVGAACVAGYQACFFVATRQTGVAVGTLIHGIASTAPAVATTLTLTEPLTATLLGVFVLAETLTPLAAAGAGLIAVGMPATVAGTARVSPRSA